MRDPSICCDINEFDRLAQYLAVCATVVVDEGGRTEPQLRAVLATRVHDAEVVLARLQQVPLLVARQLADAADQEIDLLVLPPATKKVNLTL